jgi:sterol 3beta-glucosyltransferase
MEAQAQLQLDLPKDVRLLLYLSLAIKLSGVRFLFVIAFESTNVILGNMIYKAGAGPKPIPHKELSVENLRDAIKFAISPSAKEAAKKMAHQIQEDVNVFLVTQSSDC